MSQLYEMFSSAARRQPQKVGIVESGKTYSYADILACADEWAKTLACSVFQMRPRVGLVVDDMFHSACVSLALAKINGVCVPFHQQLTAEQLVVGWQAADVNIVVYDPAHANHISELPQDDRVCLTTDDIRKGRNSNNEPETFSENDEFLITMSSGSTGSPKPIVISQAVKMKRAEQTWDLYNLTDEDVVLCASPFFHSMGQRLTFVPLLLGATAVNLGSFRVNKWLDAVSAHGVTFVIAVSSHLYALKEHLLNEVECLGTLKTIVSSSAPIDADFKQSLNASLGCDFHEIYGATEIAVATNLAPEQAREHYGTVGTPCSGIEVKIVSDIGEDLGCEQIGEIAVKSPLAFCGYYNLPDLTRMSISNGFFLTGDLGVRHASGFLSYVGRKKDIIITGGINIYPKDVEQVLSTHADVKEISVIGIENEYLGEVVVAVCSVKDGARIEKDLNALAVSKLAPFQRPLMYLLVEEIPRNAVGKIVKMDLAERFGEEAKSFTSRIVNMLYH